MMLQLWVDQFAYRMKYVTLADGPSCPILNGPKIRDWKCEKGIMEKLFIEQTFFIYTLLHLHTACFLHYSFLAFGAVVSVFIILLKDFLWSALFHSECPHSQAILIGITACFKS